jgi:hypothetical protein
VGPRGNKSRFKFQTIIDGFTRLRGALAASTARPNFGADFLAATAGTATQQHAKAATAAAAARNGRFIHPPMADIGHATIATLAGRW